MCIRFFVALNTGGFSATIKVDAKDSLVIINVPTDIIVTSKFLLQNKSSGGDGIGNDASTHGQLRTTLDEISFELEYVKAYDFDETSGVVTIEHNPYFVSAAMLVRMVRNGPQTCHLKTQPTRSSLDESASTITSADSSSDKEGVVLTIMSDGAAKGMWALPHMQRQTEDEGEKKRVFSTIAFQRIMTALSGLFWFLSLLSYAGESWYFLRWFGVVSVAFGLPTIGEYFRHVANRFIEQSTSNGEFFSIRIVAWLTHAFLYSYMYPNT